MYLECTHVSFDLDTPAETCGLEVGDIIVTINGLNVLDATHSEVVRLAHTGNELTLIKH